MKINVTKIGIEGYETAIRRHKRVSDSGLLCLKNACNFTKLLRN